MEFNHLRTFLLKDSPAEMGVVFSNIAKTMRVPPVTRARTLMPPTPIILVTVTGIVTVS